MGRLTVASNYAFDQWNFDFMNLYYGESYDRSSTVFRVNYSDGTSDEFRGTGFQYDVYGVPYGGTVTSYAGYYNGQRLFLFEGGSIPAADIAAAAETWLRDDDEQIIFNVMRGNDTLTGSDLSDALSGFDGNDLVNGNGGNDLLYGYDGRDTIIGGPGQDYIDGGEGGDTASYETARTGVVANLADRSANSGDASGDYYVSIEHLIGSGYSDRLYGDAANNGLTGGRSNDSLSGGDGDDTLVGGSGADRLYGGNGVDRASYADATTGVVASLANPAGNRGDAQGDTYSSIESFIGSGFDDRLYGNTSANSLSGGAGNDYLSGSSGNDSIHGSAGKDQLVGGSGADKFMFRAISDSTVSYRDSILDFNAAQGDRIELSWIDANAKISDDQAFNFVVKEEFSGVSGELRYVTTSSNTYIYGDVDGDKVADISIHLAGVKVLETDYFVL